MKLVLCPYGHKNEPGTRFCTTCRAAIPPDPTQVEDESDVDPKPVPVKPTEEPEKETSRVEAVPAEQTPPPETHPPFGKICPNGHWNPPDQERWCQVCAEPLFEEPETTLVVEPTQQWRKLAVGVGIVALVVVAFIGLAGALGGGEGSSTTVTTVTSEVVPTTTEPPVIELDSSAITVVEASSEQPQGDNVATNMLDGLNDTAWGHCGYQCNGTTGVGEFVRFTFDHAYTVVSFDIINGYDKVVDDEDRWEQNNRIQTMTVTADGDQSKTVSLTDTRTVQTIELEFESPTTFIQFTIDAVFEGNLFNDVSISAVEFMVVKPEG